MKTTLRSIGIALALVLSAPAIATVSTTSSRIEYTANGSSRAFSFAFPALAASDVQVLVAGVVQGGGYTVALNANQSASPGGTVTFTTAPESPRVIRLQRVTPKTQATSFAPYSAFPSRTVESTLDRVTMGIQEVERRVADEEAVRASAVATENAARASADTALAAALASVPTGLGSITVTDLNGASGKVNFRLTEPFTGYAGTAITGAPRVVLGTNTPLGGAAGDDSAILITRALTGDSLFSHAVRDESTFSTTTTGAYASYDSFPTMNGPTHYNHFRSFQARPQYNGSSPVDELSGFNAQLGHTGTGVAGNVYGVHVADVSGTGPITNNVGLWIDALSRGSGMNFAIYASGNPSYLGGNLQIAGTLTGATSGAFSGEIVARDFNATGAVASYASGGGVALYDGGTAAYLKAYSDAGGTPKKLGLNPTGGNVGVGTNDPGALFHVAGASYLAGAVQMSGALTGVTTFAASSQGTVGAFEATGTPAAYASGGGVGVYGTGPNDVGIVKAFSNSSGDEKWLSLNPANGAGVGIGTSTPISSYRLDVNGTSRTNALVIKTSVTPANAGAACTAGGIEWDSGYVYVCVAANAWKRAALASW